MPEFGVEQVTDAVALHLHTNGAVTIRTGTGVVGQSVTLTMDEAIAVGEFLHPRGWIADALTAESEALGLYDHEATGA